MGSGGDFSRRIGRIIDEDILRQDHDVDRDDGRCSEDGDDMKIAAINALIHMDSEKARPILQKVLARRDEASVCLRRKAVFLISQGEHEGAEDILLASARTDPDPEVREQAVFWLSRLQDKAIFALSQQDSPRARLALRTFAERADAPESLREQAIFWIGQRRSQENADFLRSLFTRLGKTESNDEIRKKIEPSSVR